MGNKNLTILLGGLLIVGLVGCATSQKVTTPGVGDRFEPNNYIFNPTTIEENSTIKATINPAGDIDFYKIYRPFSSNQMQQVRVTLLNQAKNLELQLIFYDQNREEIATAGARERGTTQVIGRFIAQPNVNYYIAVFSGEKAARGYIDKENSPEFYTLKVEIGK